MKERLQLIQRWAKSLPKQSIVCDISGSTDTIATIREAGQGAKATTYPETDIGESEANLPACDAYLLSHVLEHILDTRTALRNLLRAAWGKPFMVIVPPAKREFVDGHYHLFTEMSLQYCMIGSGWDLAECAVQIHGYNIAISGIARGAPVCMPGRSERGHIEMVRDGFAEYHGHGYEARGYS